MHPITLRVTVTLDGLDAWEGREVATVVRTKRRPRAAAPTSPAARVAYANEVADALSTAVRNRLVHLGEAGSPIERLGDPGEIAEQWSALLPIQPSPLAELTGPFYDTAGLRRWLGISRQALDSRIRNRTVLALATGSGQRVYPAWQWRPDRTPVPHLAVVLKVLLAGARDPWTVALWLTAPVDHGDGRTVAAWQWLDEGADPASVLAEASTDAARWAS